MDTYYICSDCAIWVANADSTGMSEEIESIVTDPIHDECGHWVVGADYDCFSWSQCARCNSTLGGDRMSAYLLERN
jgi:hypothetical protein